MKKTKFFLPSVALFFLFNALHAQIHYVNTTTNDSTSSAIGYETSAIGAMSFASGINSIAEGIVSTSFGQNNFSKGDYSITLGSNLKAIGTRTIVIGSGYSNTYTLTNGIAYAIMMGTNSDKPTFTITRSESYGKTGKIGIGNVTQPDAKLHLRADEGEEAAVFIEPHNWDGGENAILCLGNTTSSFISASKNKGFYFNSAKNYVFGDNLLFINQDGNIGIGTSQTDGYKLNVNGKILAEEIQVIEDVPGSDYVFEKEYPLMDLSMLENYISRNKHLPGVKPAEEFKKQGYKIGEMDDILLRKVEELTLYTIKQQKMIERQQKEIDELRTLLLESKKQ